VLTFLFFCSIANNAPRDGPVENVTITKTRCQ
jgi:hypothetical protein